MSQFDEHIHQTNTKINRTENNTRITKIVMKSMSGMNSINKVRYFTDTMIPRTDVTSNRGDMPIMKTTNLSQS